MHSTGNWSRILFGQHVGRQRGKEACWIRTIGEKKALLCRVDSLARGDHEPPLEILTQAWFEKETTQGNFAEKSKAEQH